MTNKMIFLARLILVSVVLLTACASGKTATDIRAGNWKLVSYGPVDAQIPAVEEVDTSLKFGTDGQVSGNMGCNSFGGEYTQKGNQITFGLLASTLMACPEPQMNQESASFAILTGSVNFTMDGDALTILDASGTNELVLIRQ